MTPAQEFLRGSYPPLVTPFANGRVDWDTYAALVDRQARNGSHGIVVNGTSAEPSVLSIDERNSLVETAVAAADSRIPVVAATGSQSLDDTLALTRAAERAGADAVLVVTPYYIRPPQRGLVNYYARVGDATRLPVLIYHIPGRAGVSMDIDAVQRVAEQVPHLAGMKHAHSDLGYVTRLLQRLGPEFRLFVGLEELSFPLLAIGASGLMNAVGNLAPAWVASLYDAVAQGDLAAARAWHFGLDELNRAVFWDTNPIPIKYMMKKVGLLTDNEHRSPMAAPEPELEKYLDALSERARLG